MSARPFYAYFFSFTIIRGEKFCFSPKSADKVGSVLKDDTGALDALFFTCLDALEQPCHLVTQIAHYLHTLQILLYLLGGVAVNAVPIVGADYGHCGNGEVLVQAIEGCAAATAAAAYDSCGGLACKIGLGVENSVKKSADVAACGCEVNGRADDHAVCILYLGGAFVYAVLSAEYATFSFAEAGTAADTAANGLIAYPENLGFNAVCLQSGGYLLKSGIGAALLVGTAVYKQYFHFCSTFLYRAQERAMF